MKFLTPLVEGRLLRRYKRFLADVELADGTVVIAHCPNPGAMAGLVREGSRVLLSVSDNPWRKLSHGWELVEAALPGGTQWIGINTLRPNALVAEAFHAGHLAPLAGYTALQPEVRYATRSRVDFVATGEGVGPCHVEVKNCHWMRRPGVAEFPDCVAARSARHMRDLAAVVAQGGRAMVIVVVQMRAEAFDVAADIDPAFALAFREARAAGVEAHAYRCTVEPDGVTIAQAIPIVTPV